MNLYPPLKSKRILAPYPPVKRIDRAMIPTVRACTSRGTFCHMWSVGKKSRPSFQPPDNLCCWGGGTAVPTKKNPIEGLRSGWSKTPYDGGGGGAERSKRPFNTFHSYHRPLPISREVGCNLLGEKKGRSRRVAAESTRIKRTTVLLGKAQHSVVTSRLVQKEEQRNIAG